MKKKRVLFLCTGNSCRSQMAEGWTHHLHKETLEVYSAGVVKSGVDPKAIQVMSEAGIDIRGQWSKTIEELPMQDFDVVITLCDLAKESCPFLPGKYKQLHQSFDDPPSLTKGLDNEDEVLRNYKRVRDEIEKFISTLPDRLA